MMTLSEASTVMQGKLLAAESDFTSVEFDTRRVESGALFFAIHGERQNGHQYIPQALSAGAVAAVVDEDFPEQRQINHIRVEDTTAALGALARHWRSKFKCPVVGITGSNGKTTVSQIVAGIFSETIPGVFPQGSFNNHWGVPLTLLKLRRKDLSAVIEMGMNHAGELSYLGDIVRPDVGLITNAAAAHLEGLGSVEGVAQAKGELIDFVDTQGVVILNRDDTFYSQWRARAGARGVISFGTHERADVQILDAPEGELNLKISGRTQHFEFTLTGEHNQLNAAAAVAVCIAVGVSIEGIRTALKKVRAVKGRLDKQNLSPRLSLIDDSYNANQASMQAAIEVLSKQTGRKILVLGGMGELGQSSAQIHRDIATFAKTRGVDVLLTLVNHKGAAYLQDMAQYLSGFGDQAMSFTEISPLVEVIKNSLDTPSTVLVKGSRFAAMENVVAAIREMEAAQC